MKEKKKVRIQPAPPASLIQEIPTPDTVHTADIPPSANDLWQPIQGKDEIPSDVLGSYTGNPDYDDRPIQDADDL